MAPTPTTWPFAPILLSFLSLLSSNLELWHSADILSDVYQASTYDIEDTFDFVIVGAGSAGAVVANRLSKDYKVLLIEAGGEQFPLTRVPATALLFLNHPAIDWQHVTVPQEKACLSLKDKKAGWSAGKVLGGTSVLNFLIYLRGHMLDYDNWANITGDSSWSYDGVLPYFKSIENYNGNWNSHKIHGYEGDVKIQLPPYTGMGNLFVKAGVEKGIPHTDLNGRFDEGVSLIYNNIQNGRRLSANTAFLSPIRNRKNLSIYKYSQVNKILMRDNGREAYGVEYFRHGEKKFAFAKKEVIISAGGIQSPKLLMLSGIGPKEHLLSHSIRPVLDLPVGKNLQDHISVYLGPFFVDSPISMLLDRDFSPDAMAEFYQIGNKVKGPLTSTGTQAAAFISSSYAKKEGLENWPDIQYIMVGFSVYSTMADDFAHGFHVDQAIARKYLAHAKGRDSFQIVVSLARPQQRGEILLKSSDPDEQLHIDPKYLQNERDSLILLEGIKRAVDLVENTTTFQRVGARFTDQPFPGCETVPFRSDAYWECYMRQYTITLHHIVGACSMGKHDSNDSVVDPQLKVIGTDNLRVIDASVMPVLPISNTHASATMIGEKGSQMLLDHWRNRENSLRNDIIR